MILHVLFLPLALMIQTYFQQRYDLFEVSIQIPYFKKCQISECTYLLIILNDKTHLAL